jgi:ribonucleoside-triphosphate reductase
VQFSKHDPVVEKLRAANYKVINHPVDDTGVLVTFPVMWDGVQFDKVDGKEVNLESAVTQLERYKLLQTSWNQQNTSVTISYSPSEIPQIIDWLLDNWDCYVGVSFIYRTDPTKTAKDLGYLYLPQEVVTEETFKEYESQLLDVNLEGTNSFDEIIDADCATGACPVK